MPTNTSQPQVQFEPVEPSFLSEGGTITDSEGQQVKSLPKPVDIGISQEEFQKQVINLVSKGTDLQKINEAIDQHPDIQGKSTAKNMADAIYRIVEKK